MTAKKKPDKLLTVLQSKGSPEIKFSKSELDVIKTEMTRRMSEQSKSLIEQRVVPTVDQFRQLDEALQKAGQDTQLRDRLSQLMMRRGPEEPPLPEPQPPPPPPCPTEIVGPPFGHAWSYGEECQPPSGPPIRSSWARPEYGVLSIAVAVGSAPELSSAFEAGPGEGRWAFGDYNVAGTTIYQAYPLLNAVPEAVTVTVYVNPNEPAGSPAFLWPGRGGWADGWVGIYCYLECTVYVVPFPASQGPPQVFEQTSEIAWRFTSRAFSGLQGGWQRDNSFAIPVSFWKGIGPNTLWIFMNAVALALRAGDTRAGAGSQQRPSGYAAVGYQDPSTRCRLLLTTGGSIKIPSVKIMRCATIEPITIPIEP